VSIRDRDTPRSSDAFSLSHKNIVDRAGSSATVADDKHGETTVGVGANFDGDAETLESELDIGHDSDRYRDDRSYSL
jgi:hypothetical protein